jgi:hypothetical protein
MAKRKKRSPLRRDVVPGHVARAPQGTLRSCQVGALPILNHFLRRMKLDDTLRDLLGPGDPRDKLSTSTSLLILLRNLLVAREPVYGVGEWAARYAPDGLGLRPSQIPLLNDDRMGRGLLRLFRIDSGNLALVVAAGVVHEFAIDLERLHNDSTTITFCGAYPDAATEKHFLGQPTFAITFGHNKDHRPDLKQLLYILTVSEDTAFRQRLQQGPVRWRPLWEKTDEEGQVRDRYAIRDAPALTTEGYRLVWYHSTRKAELDAAARATQIENTLQRLGQLRAKITSPRTRWRQPDKIQRAVDQILETFDTVGFVRVQIAVQQQEQFRPEKPGRPGPDTKYVRSVSARFELHYEVDPVRMAAESVTDGVFPLVTNVPELSELELLHAYKRQAVIEKRFSQLKTDFAVAPVYLKDVRRIQSLLCVYFLALLVEALLERELRQAMAREGIESLPLYSEGRACRWPTARRVLDLFENVERHEWVAPGGRTTVLVTELSDLQRRILKLLGLRPDTYGRRPD